MKLLYATSIVYPSGLANRLQVLAMAGAFAAKLKENFFLGGQNIAIRMEGVRIVNFHQKRSFKLGWLYIKFASAQNITHIYCREQVLLFALIFYNKFFFRRKIKFIYEIHTVYDQTLKRRLVEKFIVRNLDSFVFLTEHLRRDHTKRFKYKPAFSMIAPDGVDLSVFDIVISQEKARALLNIPPDKKVLVYTGRFRTMGIEKGLENVFKAILSLPADIIFVAMGGKPADINYYRELAAEMKLISRVILIEHLNQDMVAVCQKAADILLMPYPDTNHFRFYMSPLKMFEYMAARRPIIASDLPSVREVLSENNAVLVKPDSSEDLAKAVKLVLSNEKFASDLAENGFRDVQNYTWDKRGKKILEFIDSYKIPIHKV